MEDPWNNNIWEFTELSRVGRQLSPNKFVSWRNMLIWTFWVDDMIVVGTSKDSVAGLKARLLGEWRICCQLIKIIKMQLLRDRRNRKVWITTKDHAKRVSLAF